MPAPNHHARTILKRILQDASPEEIVERYRPRPPSVDPLPPRIPGSANYTEEALERRRAVLAEQGVNLEHLSGRGDAVNPENLQGNIENLIGFAQVPVGVIGPLRINGTCASGDYYVPIATTEGFRAGVMNLPVPARLVSLAIV